VESLGQVLGSSLRQSAAKAVNRIPNVIWCKQCQSVIRTVSWPTINKKPKAGLRYSGKGYPLMGKHRLDDIIHF
jgi:hypothetical protein